MTEDHRSIYVFFGPIPADLQPDRIELLSQSLSGDEQLRLGFMTRLKPKLHFLFGRLLLRKAFNQLGFDAFPDLSFSESGKPYLSDHPDFGVSLSHSGHLVACALGAGVQTGIDVQEQAEPDLESYQSSFSAAEWNQIQQDHSPQQAFYRLWARKEAVAKADGAGLGIDFESLAVLASPVNHDDNTWAWTDLDLPAGYCGAVAWNALSNDRALVCEAVVLGEE